MCAFRVGLVYPQGSMPRGCNRCKRHVSCCYTGHNQHLRSWSVLVSATTLWDPWGTRSGHVASAESAQSSRIPSVCSVLNNLTTLRMIAGYAHVATVPASTDWAVQQLPLPSGQPSGILFRLCPRTMTFKD